MDEYRADDGIASEWRQEKHMETIKITEVTELWLIKY